MVDIAQYSTRLEEVIKELTGDYTHDHLIRSVAKAHTLASSLLGNNHPITQQLAEGITRIGKPHSSLGYRPPAPVAIRPSPAVSAPLQQPVWAFGLT